MPEAEDTRAANGDRVFEAEDMRAQTARVEDAGTASSTYPRSRQQQGFPHEKLADEKQTQIQREPTELR